MIVVCNSCQARFKVADDKVGARGAKVRCSKCQTVFVVHREPEPAPGPARPTGGALDLDLEAGPRPGFRPGGFAADPFSRSAAAPPSADPFAAASPSRPSAAVDPFAAAASAPAAADPFAHDPFGLASPPEAVTPSLGSVDPFVATVASPGAPSAVTDLSDLLGGPAPGGAHRAPGPGLQAAAATPPPEPSGILEDGFDFASSDDGMALDDGAAFPPPAARPSPAAHAAEPDLMLDERTPARPPHAAPMPAFGEFGADPYAGQGEESLELGGPTGFGDEGPSGEAMREPAPPPARAVRNEEPPPAASAAPPAETGDPEAVVDMHRRSSRIRAIVVNAISLVALLAVALGFLAYWRGARPGAGALASLRPDAGAVATAPFTATRVRSGLYERADAPPVLFVAGAAVSHAAGAVPGLRVRVEVLRKEVVIARGEASAGAVPTPEELNASRDAAGLAEAVARRLKGKRQPVTPGADVPFLVAISDYPADVAGAALRVTVEPIEAGADAKAR
ncbi:MAG TPA: zinc-ribbon domain-containing protein [Anaeromyxobacteraceae bacterium]|nr:zinc-ribbon domain-containing protein [Anaeromyxobacteraceae bacterium]